MDLATFQGISTAHCVASAKATRNFYGGCAAYSVPLKVWLDFWGRAECSRAKPTAEQTRPKKKQPNAPQNARSGSGSSRRTRRRFFCLVKHSVCFVDSFCLKLGDAHTVLLIHFVSSQCLLSEDPRRGVTCQELLESQANSRMFLTKSANTSNEPRSGTCLVCDLPYLICSFHGKESP